MKSHDIRSSFLEFFADRGHKIVVSSPLIPHDDPTLLFVNAGMNQFKKVFLGQEKTDYRTAVSSQKCLRAGGKHNDLENVGFTVRHNTFFEMLGNFSFGDYFKEEAIAYAWEYVTRTLALDPSRLYATVFSEDDEAERLWRRIAPELKDRVLRFGEKDNYWSMGDTGPCGPCSEIHYDRGEQYPGELNGEGDRFMEIWNLVFMQFDRDESGNLTPLPKPSVDTGAGLERITMVLQRTESNYETDLFKPLVDEVTNLSGIEYTGDEKSVSHRVIADHVRALGFAIADGGIISNEGRGYVLRRILRRAARHGRLLGLHEPFLHKIITPLVKIMGGHYPELKSKQKHIELVIKSEEEQFERTLDTGLQIFEDVIKKVESSGVKIIQGEDVFKLYDTYGFPVDLTEVMARERGLHVDMESFERELEKQRERSRKDLKFEAVKGGGPSDFIRDKGIDKFVGYEYETWNDADVLMLERKNGNCDLILLQTPFYAESGGQVGDTGYIYSPDFRIKINDTVKYGNEYLHIGSLERGSIPGDESPKVTAEIDHARRADIKRNHTATHLLHKALRMVLGDHVHQSGSLVAPDRLRFDFTHFRAMTPDEIDKVEDIVNEKIKEDLPVKWKEMPFDEAKKKGAMALFGEKYGDTVRVVATGGFDNAFSMELCGGTHVDHTGEIKSFFITQETAIAAGVRRIEAVTGRGAEEYSNEQEGMIGRMQRMVDGGAEKVSVADISTFNDLISRVNIRLLTKRGLLERFKEFSEHIRKTERKRQSAKKKDLAEKASDLSPKAIIGGKLIYIYEVPADEQKYLMIYSDYYKKTHPKSGIVTVSDSTGSFAVASQDNQQAQKIFGAMKSIPGVRGGGKPTIRGSLPVDKIDEIIKVLTERFGRKGK
jgi:alanyl-tRNA synthetase